MCCLPPLMNNSYASHITWSSKFGPGTSYVKLGFCPDGGSFFQVMPLGLAKNMDMRLEKTTPRLAASDANGGDLVIEGLVKVLVLGGDKQQKEISLICMDLPEGKEPLLNVKAMMAKGFPHFDHPTGSD